MMSQIPKTKRKAPRRARHPGAESQAGTAIIPSVAASRVCSVGMSGYGSHLALSAQRPGKDGYEGWIMDATGGNQRLMTRSAAPMGSVCMSKRAEAVFGHEGIVWSAEGAEPLPLAASTSLRGARLGTTLLQDLTMDRNGRLGIYVVYDAKDRAQLAKHRVAKSDHGGVVTDAHVTGYQTTKGK